MNPDTPQNNDDSLEEKNQHIVDQAKDEMDKATDDFDDRLNDLSTRAEAANQKYQSRKAQAAKNQKSDSEAAKGLGYGLTYAYVLIGPPIFGWGIGFLIEKSTGNDQLKSWLAIGGTLLGFAAMLFLLYRDQGKQ